LSGVDGSVWFYRIDRYHHSFVVPVAVEGQFDIGAMTAAMVGVDLDLGGRWQRACCSSLSMAGKKDLLDVIFSGDRRYGTKVFKKYS